MGFRAEYIGIFTDNFRSRETGELGKRGIDGNNFVLCVSNDHALAAELVNGGGQLELLLTFTLLGHITRKSDGANHFAKIIDHGRF